MTQASIAIIDTLFAENVLSELDIHFARTSGRLAGENDMQVLFGAALASRSVGEGHICLDLSELAGKPVYNREGGRVKDLHWPDLDAWLAALMQSGLVSDPEMSEARPLVLDGNRLYLSRYWAYQKRLATELISRIGKKPLSINRQILEEGLERLFPEFNLQRVAAMNAVLHRFSVISGGPGTGKTSTVVKILALLLEQARNTGLRKPLIRLVAPTGKAAARLGQSIEQALNAEGPVALSCGDEIRADIPSDASTIHRALGFRYDSTTRFRHDADNPLPADVLVVDEASMIDLALMVKLIEAIPPQARIILLGDKDQLASVEAGSILGDIHQAYGAGGEFEENDSFAAGRISEGSCTVHLTHSYRFDEQSGIGRLAAAVNAGEAEAALDCLDDLSFPNLSLIEPGGAKPAQLLESLILENYDYFSEKTPADRLRSFDRFRILCAHRRGVFGVDGLNRLAESILQRGGRIDASQTWYESRPVLITQNDYSLKLFNGDVGLIVQPPSDDKIEDPVCKAFMGGDRQIDPHRLPPHETVYAMTVHKAQGSEYEHALVVLPEKLSPVLTRELLYTAITRARSHVTILADRAIFKTCIATRLRRSSGLAEMLGG